MDYVGLTILFSIPILIIIGLVILLKKIEKKDEIKISEKTKGQVRKMVYISSDIGRIIFRIFALLLFLFASIMTTISISKDTGWIFFSILFWLFTIGLICEFIMCIKEIKQDHEK